MSGWLRVLLGLRENEVPPDSELHFEIGALARYGETILWLAALVVVVALALIVLLYLRERVLSPFQRAALTALRLAALAVVVFMLLDPRLETELTIDRPATTFVLLDTSGSMSRRDPYEGRERARLEAASGLSFGVDQTPTRAELALSVFERDRILERLDARNRVRLYAFDSELRPLEQLEDLRRGDDGAAGSSSVSVSGAETRLGDALLGAFSQAGANPVAGIVLVSDGQENAGAMASPIGQELGRRGIPVYTIGVGKRQVPRNFAVVDLSGPEVVEVGYPLRIQARVLSSGIKGPSELVLERKGVDGGVREIVERRKLEADEFSTTRKLSFVDSLPRKGKFEYVLTVGLVDGKLHPEDENRGDNRRRIEVIGAEEKRRVLLVSGNPTYEYRHVRNFLLRDEGVQASCWLATADRSYIQDGDVVIDHLPRDARELRAYDVLILHDPDPGLLTPQFLEGLSTFVRKEGGGLVYLAGECHTPQIARRREFELLRELLPVTFDGARGRGRYDGSQPWKPLLTRAGAEHVLCQLLDSRAASIEIWKRLPPFFFAAPTAGVKPAASVLVKRDDGESVLVLHRAGAGFVLYVGTDDLWRLRSCRDGLHERLWAGIARFLSYGKSLAGSREASLQTNRDRYRLGEDALFEASLLDSQGNPIGRPQITLIVERQPLRGGDGSSALVTSATGSAGVLASALGGAEETELRVTLRSLQDRPGWYRGHLPLAATGHYRATFAQAASLGAKAETSFLVTRPMAEWDEPSPNHELLVELAGRTHGKFVDLGHAFEIPDSIPDRSVRETVGRASSTIWDSATVMLVLSGLIVLEWVLRKWWRLN